LGCCRGGLRGGMTRLRHRRDGAGPTLRTAVVQPSGKWTTRGPPMARLEHRVRIHPRRRRPLNQRSLRRLGRPRREAEFQGDTPRVAGPLPIDHQVGVRRLHQSVTVGVSPAQGRQFPVHHLDGPVLHDNRVRRPYALGQPACAVARAPSVGFRLRGSVGWNEVPGAMSAPAGGGVTHLSRECGRESGGRKAALTPEDPTCGCQPRVTLPHMSRPQLREPPQGPSAQGAGVARRFMACRRSRMAGTFRSPSGAR